MYIIRRKKSHAIPLDPFFFFDMTEIDVTEEIYCGQCESLMLSRFSRVTAERDSRDLAEWQSINFTVSIRANANYVVISMSGELYSMIISRKNRLLTSE